MDFDERIAYYKRIYAGAARSDGPVRNDKSGTRKPRQPKPKTTVEAGKQDVKKQQDHSSRKAREPQVNRVPPAPKKPKSSPDVPSAPQKKQGLLARLFKRNKGNA